MPAWPARALVALLLAVVVLPSGAASARAAGTDRALERTIAAQMRAAGGTSGASVVDLESERRLFSLAPDVRRTPASLEKLLTTSAAIEHLGERARIRTAVRSDGELLEDGTLDGDLYLQGFGDPSFGSSDLARLAARVEAAGIERVTGSVYGDESYFDSRRGLPAGGFRLSVDVGPLSALSFNEGTLSRNGRRFQANPPLFVAQRLRAMLESRGIEVRQTARAKRSPRSAQSIAAARSAPIAALVRHTNHISDNYYAEILLKGLGARFTGAGSTVAGAAVVKRFLGKLGVSANVVDGSGLSRGDALSPAAVVRLLSAAQKKPWFDAFYRSLPLAGRSGTLRKRMRGTTAAGRCRAKTGTLIGVSALAGYCRSLRNHTIAFALIMNRIDVAQARRSQDRIAAALAAYSGV